MWSVKFCRSGCCCKKEQKTDARRCPFFCSLIEVNASKYKFHPSHFTLIKSACILQKTCYNVFIGNLKMIISFILMEEVI